MSNLTRDDSVLTIQGTRIPRLGFGTWLITGKDATEGVRDALEIGYRHIDTARAYENEAEVGQGIADSGIDRADLWLTTKIWLDDFEPDKLKRAAEDSLRNLRTDYVDLLLLHWPSPDVPVERSLEAMRELQEAGRIRHAGVSNFPAGMLSRALDIVPLFADQVEYHPFLAQDALLELAQRARLHAHRVLAARARQGSRPPGADRDRRAVRQERRPGRAALAARPAEGDDRREGVEP